MKIVFSLASFFVTCISLLMPGTGIAKEKTFLTGENLVFIENKGQVKDQFGNPRSDIQYTLRGKGISVFIGEGQVHYQFYKQVMDKAETTCCMPPGNFSMHSSLETYRLDAEMENRNKNAAIIPSDLQTYYENYFFPGGPSEGVKASTCKKLTYKSIYPHIDWVLYVKNEKLEQEFVVHPGGDATQIKLTYEGQTDLKITGDGSLIAATPMGTIKESAPVCVLANGSATPGAYVVSGNQLGYRVSPENQDLVIDPSLEWATYYGPDTNNSPLYNVTSDYSGNIYACGFTYAPSTGNIATTGSFQDTTGGNGDAYLVKFDSSGHRLWATFYGGSELDWGYSVACDQAGNIYMGGFTASPDSTLIATPGSHQPSSGGGWNGYLVKFTPAGSRIWGTYYGGQNEDIIYSVACDNQWHVYVAGVATSTFNIASPGSFESVFVNPYVQFTAAFVARFDSSGVRNWGTYYEAYDSTGLSDIYNVTCSTDGANVFIAGWTVGTDSMTTSGAWQPAYGGGASDVIVVKFDSTGNRLWGTFYGGEGQDLTGSVACDRYGNLFLLGATGSDSGIASVGSFQPLRAGGMDAFLTKLDGSTGARFWGTYFGGPGDETVDWSRIATNRTTSVYIVGLTQSLTGIATAGSWQTTYGGGDHDGFMAKYDGSGNQLWTTYFGGSADDQAFGCGFDGSNVYICGKTNSASGIATAGSFDPTYDGDTLYNKGFLGKFDDRDSSYITLGVPGISTSVLSVFPNPTVNVLHVENLLSGYHILLYNILGEKMIETEIPADGAFSLGLQNIPSGIYNLLVNDAVGKRIGIIPVQKL